MNDDPNIEQLRTAYVAGLDRGQSACPPREQLAALAADSITGTERHELADHMLCCAHCLRDYQLLRELNQEVMGAGRRSWQRPAIAVAATLAVALALGLFLGTDRRALPEATTTLRTSAATVTPADGATLTTAPTRLSWSNAWPGPSQIRLYDEHANLLADLAVRKDQTARLPDPLRARLTNGRFFWTVEPATAGAVQGTVRGPYWFTIDRDRD